MALTFPSLLKSSLIFIPLLTSKPVYGKSIKTYTLFTVKHFPKEKSDEV